MSKIFTEQELEKIIDALADLLVLAIEQQEEDANEKRDADYWKTTGDEIVDNGSAAMDLLKG